MNLEPLLNDPSEFIYECEHDNCQSKATVQWLMAGDEHEGEYPKEIDLFYTYRCDNHSPKNKREWKVEEIA